MEMTNEKQTTRAKKLGQIECCCTRARLKQSVREAAMTESPRIPQRITGSALFVHNALAHHVRVESALLSRQGKLCGMRAYEEYERHLHHRLKVYHG